MSRRILRVTLAIAVAILTLTSLASSASAADAKWMVRLRAAGLLMQTTSEAGEGALTPTLLPEDAISVNDKVIPDINISYFFNPKFSAELVLTLPQEQDVTIEEGPLKEAVGTFTHLPPTLTLQYRFLPEGKIQPYVGAGVNLTLISDVKLRSGVAGADLGLDDMSIGAAAQIGADFPIQDRWFFNVDAKKVFIHSDVTVAGDKVSRVNLDPFILGAGIGIRF